MQSVSKVLVHFTLYLTTRGAHEDTIIILVFRDTKQRCPGDQLVPGRAGSTKATFGPLWRDCSQL